MSLLVISPFASLGDLSKEASVSRIVLSFATLGVLGDESGFHEVVKLVQVDIAEYWRNYPSLCEVEGYAK